MDTDGTLANKVIDADSHINLAEQELDDMVVKVLVKRQPVATDLRLIMAISKCVRTWNALAMKPKKSPKWHAKTPKQGKPPSVIQKPTKSAKNVQNMLNDVLYAFAKFDADTAQKVIAQDQEIDDMYKSASRAVLTYVMEDSRNVAKIIDIMWVLRSLEERIAAHARNMAEQLLYCITGEDVRYQKSAQKIAEQQTTNN